jgi:hypothetical protein
MGASGQTPTCNACERPDSFSGSICSRARCDLATANHCPSTAQRQWQCVHGSDGAYHCYETCPTDGSPYNCYEPLELCNAGYCY